MKIRGDSWTSRDIPPTLEVRLCGVFREISMDISMNLHESQDLHGSLWIDVHVESRWDLPGRQFISIHLHGFPWISGRFISMDLHGSPFSSP